jgi:hypothetical protein
MIPQAGRELHRVDVARPAHDIRRGRDIKVQNQVPENGRVSARVVTANRHVAKMRVGVRWGPDVDVDTGVPCNTQTAKVFPANSSD